MRVMSCYYPSSSVAGAADVDDFVAVDVGGMLLSGDPLSGGEVLMLSEADEWAELLDAGAMDVIAVIGVTSLTSRSEGEGEIIISGWEIIISDAVPPFGVDLGGAESTGSFSSALVDPCVGSCCPPDPRR